MRDSAHGTPTPSTGGDVAPPPVFRKARRALSVELQRSPSRRAPLRSGDSFFQFPSWRALLFLEKSDASTAEPPRAKRRLSWVDDVRPELRRRAAWLFFSEETFPDAEKEAAFQERWRDENRAAVGRSFSMYGEFSYIHPVMRHEASCSLRGGKYYKRVRVRVPLLWVFL